MIRFYAPDIAKSGLLPESDSGHCVRVLRMHAGDSIEVVDGRGNLYHCVLAEANQRGARVEIQQCESLPKSWEGVITIAIAPPKNADRMEWLVEKMVEIGVDRIVPLRCEHSERKSVNVERLRKIAVSAMKQSLKARCPEIPDTVPYDEFIEETHDGDRYIAYCDKNIPRQLLSRLYRTGSDTCILIGPEGDFSPREIRQALDSGWQPVSLGDERLRTETAALVACDTCHIISQLQ